MARRNSKASTTDQATEATDTPTPDNEENTVTDTATESEAPEATTDEATEAPLDISNFQSVVESALSEADESTGDIPVANISAVTEAYRELDGIKPKNAAKNYVEEQLKLAVDDMDIQKARSYSKLRDNLKAGGSSKSGGGSKKAPADPKVAFVSKLAAHQIAMRLVQADVPEGLDLDACLTEADTLATELAEQVEAQTAYLNLSDDDRAEAEKPDTTAVVRTAFKLAAGKASGGGRTSGGSGVRRDTAVHIEQVFADLEPGTFLKVSEIAKAKSAEYGDDEPSQGAISARLFPSSGNCTVPGVEPVEKTDDNPRGARKV